MTRVTLERRSPRDFVSTSGRTRLSCESHAFGTLRNPQENREKGRYPDFARHAQSFQQYVRRVEQYRVEEYNSRVSKEGQIVTEGTVTQVLPGTMFRVDLPGQRNVLAHISGKMRKHFIRIVPGDKVSVELSPYDLTKARIIFREQ